MRVIPCLVPSEAIGEFTDVAGADQTARGGMPARPWPSNRRLRGHATYAIAVLAPEPVKFGVLVVPTAALVQVARSLVTRTLSAVSLARLV